MPEYQNHAPEMTLHPATATMSHGRTGWCSAGAGATGGGATGGGWASARAGAGGRVDVPGDAAGRCVTVGGAAAGAGGRVVSLVTATGLPHAVQNFFPGRSGVPQKAHTASARGSVCSGGGLAVRRPELRP